MKQHFVQTSNHFTFMAEVAAVENRGSPEACILLATGSPGTGKSVTVDSWGAKRDAIYLAGVPGMGLSFLRDYLADQTGVVALRKFAQHKHLIGHLKKSRQPIIMDEAQHGLPDRAGCIEYLRRVAEEANVMLVLVCHTSERHRFSKDRLAHIATRITAEAMFKPASVEDCAIYLKELCEVSVDAGIVKQVFKQSGGYYRLMANAGKTLEVLGGKLGKRELTAADTHDTTLCEDAMKALKREQK